MRAPPVVTRGSLSNWRCPPQIGHCLPLWVHHLVSQVGSLGPTPRMGMGPSMEGPKTRSEDPRSSCSRTYKQIEYKFFSKPTGSKFVILENSAAPYQQKKSVLAQETVRRLMNTSENTSTSTKLEIINTFDMKLEKSGYSLKQRREIIESGIIGYKRKIDRQKGVRHRKGTDTKKDRMRKKLKGKTSWFRVR